MKIDLSLIIDFHRQWTSVWTSAGRWVRKSFTVWNTSTTPSYRIRSKTILNVRKTPVLPAPRNNFNEKILCFLYLKKKSFSQFTSWTMNNNRSFLTKTFFSFVNLTDEINETFAHFRHALFWPFRVKKMTNCSRLTVLIQKQNFEEISTKLFPTYSRICHFEFTK